MDARNKGLIDSAVTRFTLITLAIRMAMPVGLQQWGRSTAQARK